jgi:hypothetical protein
MTLNYWLRKKRYYSIMDRLTESGRCYVVEINVGKTKAIGISRQPSPVHILIDRNNWQMWNISNIWV